MNGPATDVVFLSAFVLAAATAYALLRRRNFERGIQAVVVAITIALGAAMLQDDFDMPDGAVPAALAANAREPVRNRLVEREAARAWYDREMLRLAVAERAFTRARGSLGAAPDVTAAYLDDVLPPARAVAASATDAPWRFAFVAQKLARAAGRFAEASDALTRVIARGDATRGLTAARAADAALDDLREAEAHMRTRYALDGGDPNDIRSFDAFVPAASAVGVANGRAPTT